MSKHDEMKADLFKKSVDNESTPLMIGRVILTPAPLPININVDKYNARSRLHKLQRLAQFVVQTSSSFSDRERRRHESRHGSSSATHLGAAAGLIRDAVLGDEEDVVENPADGSYDPYTAPNETEGDKFRNAVALACRRWCCPTFHKLLWMALAVLIAVTFLEPPHWCRDDPTLPYAGCETYLSAKGIPAGASAINDKEESNEQIMVAYYPNTGCSKSVCFASVAGMAWLGFKSMWFQLVYHNIVVLQN